MSYKHIICSGDSYTAGHELAADTLIPNYFSYNAPVKKLTDNENAERKKMHEQLTNLESNLAGKMKNDYWDLSKQRAWPGKIKNLTNLDVKNVGHRGISNHEISYRVLETAFQSLDVYESKDILCFIMLSNPVRLGTPSHNIWGGEYEYRSLIPWFNINNIEPEKMAAWFKRMLEDYDDYDYLHESFIHIQAAKSTLTQLGIKTVILDSGLWTEFGKEYSHPIKPDRFDRFTKLLDIELESFFKVGFEMNFKRLPGGHMEESLHDLYAEMIIKKFL